MDDIKDFSKVLFLPPVKTRLSSYTYFGKGKREEQERVAAAHKKNLQKTALEARKDAINFDLLRQVVSLHRKPRIDVGCFFDPGSRVKNVMDSFVTLTPSDRTEALGRLKKKYHQKTLSQYGFDQKATTLYPPYFVSESSSPNVAGTDSAENDRRPANYTTTSAEKPLHQTKYMQLYDRIVELFNNGMEKQAMYSERIQQGIELEDHQKRDTRKIQILFKQRRLELPRNVKSKFTKVTNAKFDMQSHQGKIKANGSHTRL